MTALPVLAAVLAVGAALAQTSAPTFPECSSKKASKDDVEAAKNAHRVATQFYDRADYDKAIQYWTDSYKFDCSATDLLINIANSYEKKGDRAATIAVLEVYLKRGGTNPTIPDKVNNLKAAMAQPSASASVPPPPPTAAPVVVPTAAPTVVPTAAPSGERPYGIKPWFLVGGGGALAIVGAVLLPIGAGNISTASSACPNRDNCGSGATGAAIASQGNTGRTEAGVGWGLLSVGVAAAAGGLIWQFAFNKPGAAPPPTTGAEPRVRDLWLTPTAGRSGSGLAAGGSF